MNPSTMPPAKSNTMKSLLVLLLTLILVLGGLGIGLSNTQPVALSFMGFRSIELPVFLWLLLAIAVGALCAGCLGAWRQLALKREIRRLRRALGKQ